MDIENNELLQVLCDQNEPQSHILRELVQDPDTLNNISVVGQALYLAVGRGFLKSVRILLEAGVSPNSRITKNGNEETALHNIAGEEHRTAIILELLKYGADVNAEDLRKRTALHRASMNRNCENMQILLENGAMVNTMDDNNRTPLHMSLNSVHVYGDSSLVPRVQMLLKAGADVNISDGFGMGPLYYAVRCNSPQAIQLLVQNKADANTRDNYGYTPLHRTAWGMKEPRHMIRELLKGGARLNASDNKGHAPIYYAVTDCDKEATQELLHWGADFEIVECLESLLAFAFVQRPLDDVIAIAQELLRYVCIKNSHSLVSICQQLMKDRVGNILSYISSSECNLEDFKQACLREVEALSKVICDCGKSSMWGSINNLEECNCDTHQAILKYLFSGRNSNFTEAFLHKLDEDFILEDSLNLMLYFAFKESKKRLILPWTCLKEIERHVSSEDILSFLRSKQSEMGASEYEKFLKFTNSCQIVQ